MQRRAFLGATLASIAAALTAASERNRWDKAVTVLDKATSERQVSAAVLHVVQRGETFSQAFGTARSADALFLLGSVSKPINIAAVMSVFDEGRFRLDDPVKKFLPKFTGDGREKVSIRHLLTHVSGLPDQLESNEALRRKHAPLQAFVDETLRTPLAFAPGSRYQYSSMGILLACYLAAKQADTDPRTLVERRVFQPLGMKHSAQGLGRFRREELLDCQMDGAAPESGAGDPKAKEWDWNSDYWRKLGAPWGGTHASAPDIGRFLAEFLYARGKVVKPATAKEMIRNQHPKGWTPRGLGFAVGSEAGSPGCSERTFGHTGSTGTLCWADPATETICVVLTTLPRRGAKRHPRELASEQVAAAVSGMKK
jgi:CubicO group peptidase (beta-lactamase class C family)